MIRSTTDANKSAPPAIITTLIAASAITALRATKWSKTNVSKQLSAIAGSFLPMEFASMCLPIASHSLKMEHAPHAALAITLMVDYALLPKTQLWGEPTANSLATLATSPTIAFALAVFHFINFQGQSTDHASQCLADVYPFNY